MAINFPNSPANGDTHTAAGTIYVYDATNSVWKRQGSSGGFDPASVSESLIPDANETYDLGSSTNKFRDLYLSGNSITLGTVELSDNGGALEVTPTGGGSAEPFATETYVTTQVNNLVDAAPGALDTLNELAAALGDDAAFSTTVTNSLATKADASSLATVATSGSYNDLSNKPTIPTAIDQTANVLSGASPQIDLTNNYFKIDLISDTTFSTTGSPTNGEWYEGKIEVKGNASQLTHNLITNPSNQISSWRTTASTPTISGFYSQGYSPYGVFAVSPNGQYAINGAYVGTGDYKFQIIEFSTPGVITSGSLVYQSGNVHGTIGGLNQRSNVYFATNTKFVTANGYVITMPSGSISSSNPYGTLPSTSTAGQGNWSSDGTKYIGVVEAQNQDPIFKLYTASTPFYANTLTLTQSHTFSRFSISGDHSLKIDHGNNVHISDDGLNLYTAGYYQLNNWSNQMMMHFTLSTAFNLSTMTYTGNNLTGSYATFGHGRFIEGGAQYWAPKSNGVYGFQNLNTPAVLNTTTWPGTWSWEGGVSHSAPPNNETDIINFVSTDGGSTFNAWVEKDSDKSAGFDGQYSSLTGTPTIPSISGLATETYVNTQVSNLVDSSPATLDTLNELAAALGDDANFSTTITNQIAAKADAYSIVSVTTSSGNFYIDGEQQGIVTLQPGRTYRFDQSDASNNSHPLRFSEVSDGTHAGGGATEYTTGVTVNGTAGNAGAYVEVVVTNATPRLYYYCANHSGMGGKVSVGKEMFVERINSDTWITGPIQTDSVNVGTGGQINASLATLDFTNTTVNFSGATISGLSNSDVGLANIADNAQGVVVTGKVAANSLDIGTGGSINAQLATLDFTYTTANFSGATVAGLGDTIQDEVDFHLNKNNSGGTTIISDGQILSWNATAGDYEWITQSGGGSVEVSATAPSSPSDGDMWFDSTNLLMYVYYTDSGSSQWVQSGGSSGANAEITNSENPPSAPAEGELWFDTTNLLLYVYYNDGTSSQWVQTSGFSSTSGLDVSDLTDTTNLLFDGQYSSLTGAPTLFDGQYSSLTGAPTSSTAGALGTLTKTFVQNEEAEITLSETISPVPNVSVFKEVPQGGLTSKGNWDVNANATNYEFFDEKPISYASTTLTPSATGDGTFDSSNPISRRHIPASTAATTYATYGAGFSGGQFSLNNSYWGGALLSDDGTKFWMVRNYEGSNSDEAHIYAWTLSTPFRVDTAAAVGSAAVKVITEMTNISTMLFNNDGTKIVCANGNNFYQFDLSTAYDLSTMGSGTESNWRIDLQRDPLYIDWSGSGDKLIVTEAWTTGGHSTRVRVFDLNTPYDITTMANLPVGTTTSFDANNPYYSIYSSNVYQKGWKISQDGLKFYAIDAANGKTLTKELPSAWVMRTGSVTTGDQYGLGDGNNWNTVAEDDYDLITGTYNNVSWTQNGSAIILFNSAIAPNYLDIIPLPATQVFPSTDVGKKVVGNSGSAIITATSGTYTSVTPFADTSAISSWQLFGAQGKSDGSGIQLTSIGGGYDFSSLSYTGRSFYLTGAVATLTSAEGMSMKPDGTKIWVIARAADKIVEFSLSTPYEIDTASSTGTTLDIFSYESAGTGIHVNSQGTRLIIIGSNQDEWNEFHLSTGWDLTTATHDQVTSIASKTSGVTGPQDLVFNNDGTRMFIIGSNTDRIFGYTLSTAFDISTLTSAGELLITPMDGTPGALSINNDGTEFYISGTQYDNLQMIKLDTAYDLSSYNASESLTYSWTSDGSGIGTNSIEGITISKSGTKLYLTAKAYIYEYDFGAAGAGNFNAYSPVLTNATGQINSSAWVDLDSMVADETKNNGDVFYAVSTDDRTSWGVIKDGDGVRKIVKNNSGTWQYNNNTGTSTVIGYDLSNSATLNKTLSYTSQDAQATGMAFNNDGTKLYLTGEQNSIIHEYALSTAYDISTSSYNNVTFNPSVLTPLDIKWKPDGTKLYVLDYDSSVRGTIYTFNVSTAWDITTASSASETFRGNAQDSSFIKFAFKTDGTRLYKLGRQGNRIHAYDLSTAWDVSSASYASEELPMGNVVANSTVGTSMNGIAFNSSGTKLFVAVYHSSNTSNNRIYEIDLSTAWDIGIDNNANGNYAGVYLNTDRVKNVLFNGNGGQVYAMNNNTGNIVSFSSGSASIVYGTSETWVNGTNNNEHATLQEALGAQSFNRMDKAQLQAVTDPNHYVLGDTLDLMIAPYAASGTSPLSDGVTIGYQADALIKQAINGTDYEAEFPATNKVKIKSLAAQNLKIRII